jgi:hypothetical protein
VDQAQAIRKFRRASKQLFEVALFMLLNSTYFLEAIYLAGYGVECALKALIFKRTPTRSFEMIYDEVTQGQKAHNFEYLKHILERKPVSCRLPVELVALLKRVNTWSTDLRYETGQIEFDDAEDFVDAAREILKWVERSL